MAKAKPSLRAVNRELHKIGEHICTGCGERHPQTEEYYRYEIVVTPEGTANIALVGLGAQPFLPAPKE